MKENASSCVGVGDGNFSTVFGQIDVPEWEAFLTVATLSLIILLTIVGNVLVILSVFTHKPLRIVQNFFIVSLAVADLTVAVLVLPLNVVYSILGRWVFGIHVCKMWLTSDVLCCTASILNLCAIALDRFWAITDPINYAQKRTVKRVLLMIAGVWLLSLLISSPPLVGWNDWPDSETFLRRQECKLTERRGYVIYSSLGSFFIPLFIMTIVYVEIFIATKRRLRERAQASKINAISRYQSPNKTNNDVRERESVSSETNHNEHPETNGRADKAKKKTKKRKDVDDDEEDNAASHLTPMLTRHREESDVNEATDKNKGTVVVVVSSSTATTVTLAADSKTSSPKIVLVEPSLPSLPPLPPQQQQQNKKPGIVYQFIEEKQRISLSKERRAARTLGIIMGVFVVCWLPFFLMYVIIPFCTACCPSKRFINFITWLGYINSVLNPIIYTIFNMDFRRAFRKLLGLPAG